MSIKQQNKPKVWYKWPYNYYEKNWKPWYDIVRGVVFIPMILIPLCFMYALYVLAFGFDEANDMWEGFF